MSYHPDLTFNHSSEPNLWYVEYIEDWIQYNEYSASVANAAGPAT